MIHDLEEPIESGDAVDLNDDVVDPAWAATAKQFPNYRPSPEELRDLADSLERRRARQAAMPHAPSA